MIIKQSFIRTVILPILIIFLSSGLCLLHAGDYWKFNKALPQTTHYFSPEGGVCSPISKNGKIFFSDKKKGIVYVYSSAGFLNIKINLRNLIGDGDLSNQIATDNSGHLYVGKNLNGITTIYKIKYQSQTISNQLEISNLPNGTIQGLSITNSDSQLIVQIKNNDDSSQIIQFDENLKKTHELYIEPGYGNSILASSTGKDRGAAFFLTKKEGNATDVFAFYFDGQSIEIISDIEDFVSLSYNYSGSGELYVYSRKYSTLYKNTNESNYIFNEELEFTISTYNLSGSELSTKSIDHSTYMPRPNTCDSDFSFYDETNSQIVIGDSELGRLLFLAISADNIISMKQQWPNSTPLEYVTDVHIDDKSSLISDFITGIYNFKNGSLKKATERAMSVTGDQDGHSYYKVGPFDDPSIFTTDNSAPSSSRYVKAPASIPLVGTVETTVNDSRILDRPYVIEYDQGTLYTAEMAGKIYTYDQFLGYKSNTYDLNNGLNELGLGEIALGLDEVALDLEINNRNLYLVTSKRIYIFSLDEKKTTSVHSDRYFNMNGITFDDSGNIYVSVVRKENAPSSLVRAGIKVFDLEFNQKTLIGDYGDMPSQIKYPRGLQFHQGKLYVADAGNNRVVVFEKFDRPDYSKAIIVAAENDRTDSLWEEIQSNAHHAFLALNNQGYTKENIFYLNHKKDTDLDDNGLYDEVDALATEDNLQYAITQWAAEDPPEDIVLYLIGHGGKGTFSLGDGALITADQLNDWINVLEDKLPGNLKITIIYDACYSGSFIKALSNANRTILTSTQSDNLAYFQDAISFSRLLWNEIFNGEPLLEAFKNVKVKINGSANNQIPQLDSNGNGTANEDEDYSLISEAFIGTGTTYTNSAPIIGSSGHTPVIENVFSSTITAYNVSGNEGIARVWGIVRQSPGVLNIGETAIQDLPTFDLLRQEDGNYRSVFKGLQTPGTYEIAIYAEDILGNISLPAVETIHVLSSLSNRAILVYGVNSEGKVSQTIKKQTEYAYNALMKQGFLDAQTGMGSATDNLHYFGSDSAFEGKVDSRASKDGIFDSLRNLPINGVFNLLLYLVGDINDEEFILQTNDLNTDEGVQLDRLSLAELNKELLIAQSKIEGILTVIHEGNGSGELIAELGNYSERIVISSSAINQNNYLSSESDVSFSQYFWNKVATGSSIGDAFSSSEARIRLHQSPQISSDGNNHFNQKNDRFIATKYYIGNRIITASTTPLIGTVASNQVLEGNNTAHLWAKDITFINGSEDAEVWAIVKPPGYDSLSDKTGKLSKVALHKTDRGIWAEEISTFSNSGIYTIQYYAKDKEGQISPPITSYVTQNIGKDVYEPDDSFTEASTLSARTNFKQWHNFSDSNDIDYIRFYASPLEGTYTIKVDSTNSKADTKFSLYNLAQGETSESIRIALGVIGAKDEFEVDTLPSDSVEIAYWKPEFAGHYYIKISPAEPVSQADFNNGYTLSIYPTNSDHEATISGHIIDSNNNPIKGARVFSEDNIINKMADVNGLTNDQGGYYIVLKSGSYSISVEHPDYQGTTTISGIAEQEVNYTRNIRLPSKEGNIPPSSPDNTLVNPVIQNAKLKSQTAYLDQVVIQILQINTNEDAQLHKLKVIGSGSGDESSDIKSISLYLDNPENRNMELDSDDKLITTSLDPYLSDDGETYIDLSSPFNIPAGLQHLIITYELNLDTE